jgi:pilus assembly protein CpaE
MNGQETMTAPPQPASPAPWKPLVVCPHPALGTRLTAALREVVPNPPAIVAEYPRMGSLAALAAEKSANLCFIDVATNAEHAQVLISEVAPLMPVVALLARNDADLILRCLRRGACEFLSEPGADSLRGVLERLGRARGPAVRNSSGAAWCVVPGKPGCGASTVAVHLAIQASAGGGKVLLVDTDALAASAAFLLKLKPEFHLGDVLRDWKRMDEDLWNRLILQAGGIDVLAAPEDPALRFDYGRLSAELTSFWRQRYQAVVLDLADVRAAADSGFAAQADAVLLVTTNEIAALQTTRRALQCLDQVVPDRGRLRLLLNRYTPATGLKREDVQKALAVEPFATLCNDYETIQSALLEGRPAPAGSRFASSMEALCRQLQDKPGPAPKRSSWLASMLSRK